jgi:hypothetical protein
MKIWPTIAVCIALAACSSEPRLPPEAPLPLPDISKNLPTIRSVSREFHLTGQLLIAGPFDAPVQYDNPYIICLRSASETQFTVALFYKGDKYQTSRIATMADSCDSASYQPLPDSAPDPGSTIDKPHRGKRKLKRDQ